MVKDSLAQGVQQIPNLDEPAKLADLEIIFSNVVTVAIGFAGIITFIVLMMGAISYITAGDDPGKVEGARKTITYGIYGLIFVALAFLFLQIIAFFTGVGGITNFTIYR